MTRVARPLRTRERDDPVWHVERCCGNGPWSGALFGHVVLFGGGTMTLSEAEAEADRLDLVHADEISRSRVRFYGPREGWPAYLEKDP